MRYTTEDCPREWQWRATTDGAGKAIFHIQGPPPPVLKMSAGPIKTCTRENWGRQDGGFETQEILQQGIVTQDEVCDRKGKLKGKFLPKPGELVIFAKPYTEWDHFLDEMVP
jgi:hypothetical protein